MKFDAPRILNAPPVCRFSHLKNASIPAAASKPREVITGVHLAMGRMREMASRMSSKSTQSLFVSVTGMFVHHILQRLALEESIEVFEKRLHRRPEKSFHSVGRVRGNQDVGHLVKRMARGQGFDREHIESRSANLAGLKGLNQRSFIDHRSSSDIDRH